MTTSILQYLSSTARWLQRKEQWAVEMMYEFIDWMKHSPCPRIGAAVGVGTALISRLQGTSWGESIQIGLVCSIDATGGVFFFQKLLDQVYRWKYGMPPHFWRALKINNQGKDLDAPAVLVLQANEDRNCILSDISSYTRILEIAKSHYLAFKVLRRRTEISQKIQEARQELGGRPIQILVVNAHGSPSSIRFGKESPSGLYQISDVQPDDFALLSFDATIILISCDTGQQIAQKISDVSHRVVVAPCISLSPYRSFTFHCPRHHRVEMHAYNHIQHCRVFEPEKLPVLPCPLDADSFSARVKEL